MIHVIESKSRKYLCLSYLIATFFYNGSEYDNNDDGCNDKNVEIVYGLSLLHDSESNKVNFQELFC